MMRQPQGFFTLRAVPALLLLAAGVQAQPAGVLFPQPFVVEHHAVHTDGDGTAFYGATVTDYYGGSWIVSVRPDDSRMIVDLARRQLTEVRPDAGTYWTLAFDRVAELRDRLVSYEMGRAGRAAMELAAKADDPEPEFEISDTAPPPKAVGRGALGEEAEELLASPSVRHLRLTVKNRAAAPPFDAWVDERVRLAPAARAALDSFAESVLGPAPAAARPGAVPVARYLAAVHRHAGGAFPVRTVRPLDMADGKPRGSIEDVATRLETLARFPLELLEVPDGLRRVSHPMEVAVAFAEQDEERARTAARPSIDPRQDPRR